MSNTSFPYNQTVAAFSPVIGGNSGTTIVVGAYSSGFSLCQIQPNGLSSSNELQFTWNCIGNIQNSGSSSTAMTFLTNGQNQANNTQYLLTGSEAGDLYLYAVEIEQNASALTASNLSSSTKIASFDSAVASICYDPQATTSNNLFVTLANGDVYAYSVSFNNSFTTGMGSMTNLLYCNSYSLVMSSTGSLVLYSPGYKPLWNSTPCSEWDIIPNPIGGTYNDSPQNTKEFWAHIQNGDLIVTMGENLGRSVNQILWSGSTSTVDLALGDNGTVFIMDTANNATLATLYQGSGSMSTWVVLESDYLTNLSAQQWSSSYTAPTLTQTVKNTSLSSASGGQVQIAPLYVLGKPTCYLITGISGAGLYYFVADTLNPAALTIASTSVAITSTVAVAVNGSTVYVATENALYEGTWNSGSWGFGGFTQLWPTSGQTITSLSFSNCQNTIYTQGALNIGTFSNNDSGDSGTGGVWTYNLATGSTQSVNGQIPGATWSVLGDVAGYVLVNSGSTGLAIVNLCPSAQLETEYFQMIDNQGSSTKKPDGIGALITAALAMAFSIVTFDPAALATSITGVVVATAGLGEAGAATGEAITGNNAPSGIPTSNSGSD